ncbi:MAG: hypothetical protein CME59_16345 [Halioglobus sp.]|nr:hypothetical protein [Halioglobus sp.]
MSTGTHVQARNAALTTLWRALATHDRHAFQQDIVPIYTALLAQLQTALSPADAEQQLLALLARSARACDYRWTLRLPLLRPGTDYRRYEGIYTYALVTAMAVDCLQRVAHPHAAPDALAAQLLPPAGLAALRGDPLVWTDWLGYFEQAAIGGLYAVSIGERPDTRARGLSLTGDNTSTRSQTHTQTHTQTPGKTPGAPKATPAPDSGRSILAAIREGLAAGALSFNQPGDPVQVDREGRTFLEYPAILHWSIARLDLDADFRTVKNRFERVRLYRRDKRGRQLFRGRLRARDPRVRGYVFEDAAVLWHTPPAPGRFVIEHLTALT